MKLRARTLALVGGAGLVVILVLSAFAYDYVENNPKFCTSCHSMDHAYQRWEQSGHKDINCHACHVSDLAGNLRRLVHTFTSTTTEVSSHAEIDRSVCLKCHESIGADRWQHVLNTTGHARHAAGKKPVQCVECHSQSIHAFAPPTQVCTQCHESKRVHEKMDELECLSCHNFLAQRKKRELRPTAEDCRYCHGENRVETDLRTQDAKRIPLGSIHGALDCRNCHSPHAETRDTSRTGRNCTACHQGDFHRVKNHGPDKHRDCTSCHHPHDERHASATRCLECHEDQKSPMAHLHKDRCDTCHTPHRFVGDRRDCSACHADVAISLAAKAPERHETCAQCHAPHGPKAQSATCARCHKKQEGPVTHARVKDHRECTSCHDQHAGRPEPEKPCAKCHETLFETVASSAQAEHGKCRNCHRTSHGNPEVKAATCAKCHADELMKVAPAKTPDRHRACESCHTTHRAILRPKADACATCHEAEAVGSKSDPHGETCTKCHAPHGPPEPKVADCKACHDKVHLIAGRGGAKHNDCKNCHEPHGQLKRTQPRCEKCHENKAKSLVVWASATDHTRCASCHMGHNAGDPKPCATCHTDQAKLVQGSRHADCKQCHPPHDTVSVGRTAWRTRCEKCHENRAKEASRRGPTHATCDKCHDSHKVTPPDCKSCHTEIQNQLLHRVDAHQNEACDKCHPTHAPTVPSRSQCSTCHLDKAKTHFPEARRCDSCHPFARGAKEVSVPRPNRGPP